MSTTPLRLAAQRNSTARVERAASPQTAWQPASPESHYYLLPFRYHALSPHREILVNEVGDYLIAERGTAARVAAHAVTRSDPIYQDLVANFFISDSPVPELIDVLATRYRTKKAFLETFTSLHIIVVTLRCNHSCHYCQVTRQTEDKEQFDLSDANLDRALHLVFRSPAPEITIEFQGGEPLAAFHKVTRAVEVAEGLNKEHRKKLRFVLCTNLALITREQVEYCRLHNMFISTSLDGPEFLHDANRPFGRGSSYRALQDGLRLVREVLGHDRVSALMTTSRLSLDQAEAIVDAYVDNGFRHLFVRPMHPYGFANRLSPQRRYTVDEFLGFYKRSLAHILKLNSLGTPVVEDYASIILRKILTPFSVGFVDLRSPSGIINDVIVYNYDGGVYVSDEARMLAESGDHTFRLGHVMDSYQELFYGAKAHAVAEDWANEGLAGCADCGLQAYCGADPVRHYATQGDSYGYRPTSAFCKEHMEIISHLLQLLDSDAAVAQILRRWAA